MQEEYSDDGGWDEQEEEEEESKVMFFVATESLGYECQTGLQIENFQFSKITHLVNSIHVSRDMARALLLVYKWDLKKASDSFWNQGPLGIFKFDPNAAISPSETCNSCYEDYPL